MNRFFCVCGQELFFENVHCLGCERQVGFCANRLEIVTLSPLDAGSWAVTQDDDCPAQKLCENYAQHNVCNWTLEARQEEAYCLSCRLNETIPDLSVDGNLALWSRIEAAKRRLLYALLKLGLNFQGNEATGTPGLRFAALADTPTEHVTMGHADGLITISLAEADEAQVAMIRARLGEPYRTLLGHLRHESGHYFWQVLIENSDALTPVRALFGDESQDYAAALANYYRDGAPSDWGDTFVSAYATAHPYEDWAESWAHYLHIRDTLETARAYGLSTREVSTVDDARDHERDFTRIVAAWAPFSMAVNALNRSMGQPDMYPFALSPTAVSKLQFIHELVLDTACNDDLAQAPLESPAQGEVNDAEDQGRIATIDA